VIKMNNLVKIVSGALLTAAAAAGCASERQAAAETETKISINSPRSQKITIGFRTIKVIDGLVDGKPYLGKSMQIKSKTRFEGMPEDVYRFTIKDYFELGGHIFGSYVVPLPKGKNYLQIFADDCILVDFNRDGATDFAALMSGRFDPAREHSANNVFMRRYFRGGEKPPKIVSDLHERVLGIMFDAIYDGKVDQESLKRYEVAKIMFDSYMAVQLKIQEMEINKAIGE
jgi:hypothetical protein